MESITAKLQLKIDVFNIKWTIYLKYKHEKANLSLYDDTLFKNTLLGDLQ